MVQVFRRRDFVRFLGAAGLGLGWATAGTPRLLAGELANATPHAAKHGWRVGSSAWTFRQYSFLAMLDQLQSLGLRCLEGMSWQPVGKEYAGVETNEAMPADVVKAVQQRLADHGIKLVSCYMRELPNNEAVCRRKFDWGKQMGLEYFTAEPAPATFDLLEKLCDEYQISLAIHNHLKPSSLYWNPDAVVKATHGRSKRFGACADTGNFVRSGLDPVACLKKLEGRLIGLHMKDLAEAGKAEAHEVPWGQGVGKIEGILREVKRQKAAVVFDVKYDEPGDKRAVIARSLGYFDHVAARLPT
jgi:sugar phosphate isomerase/epimerase